MNSPLQTDLYQLTMAAAYWQAGKADQESAFQLFFRRLPFKGGYAIAAGLAPALEWLKDFRFRTDEIDYLSSLRTKNDYPLFQHGFLSYLADLRLALDVDAIPEGSAVFAHEPLLRIQGPILHAQLVETALLNIINFQTLIATKAARICHAAAGARCLSSDTDGRRGPTEDFRKPRCLDRWLRGDIECARGKTLRHSRARHSRPFLGHVV